MERKKEKKGKKENKSESSSSTSIMFGKVKLTRAQKKLKKLKKSLKSIKNKNIRTNVIYLYELTKVNNKDLKDKKALDKALIYQKKLDLFVKYYNKIREMINTSDLNLINQIIIGYDNDLYSINEEDKSSKISNSKDIKSNKSNDKNESKNENDNNKEIKSKNSSQKSKNNINEDNNKEIKSKNSSKKSKSKSDNYKESNNEIDSISRNINSNEKIENVGPIKNFWKIALINSQFFYISKRDVAILNYLDDVIFIPLKYPNYRIEFHFKENEYTKQKILSKEYYYSNVKKEKLNRSIGCEIEWEEDDKNPTLKLSKKKLKEIENMKKIKNKKNKKEESAYVNCHSFFNMFDIDKCTIEKDFIEANFISDDFLPNILEYYLNIIEIKYDNEEDELQSNN